MKEPWRDRFERATDNRVNHPIYHDRPSADPATYRDPLPKRMDWRWWEAARETARRVRLHLGGFRP